ncbi:MAG: hypothetical protein NTV71_03550 [Candidatus Omnitrophica bacterium]|nr:hypothetical protein [Candidatus Omnitrophota bacterium]
MERLGRFLGAFFGAFLCVVLLMGIYSMAEDITLTTYYPAPYGAYNEMSVSQAVSTNNTTSALIVSSTDNDTLAPVISASTRLNGLLLNANDVTSTYYILNVRSGATSRFYVRNDGYVGINNTAPTCNLDVTGTVNATTYSAGGTAPVADGTYIVGDKITPITGNNGTITVKGGIITAIQQAT